MKSRRPLLLFDPYQKLLTGEYLCPVEEGKFRTVHAARSADRGRRIARFGGAHNKATRRKEEQLPFLGQTHKAIQPHGGEFRYTRFAAERREVVSATKTAQPERIFFVPQIHSILLYAGRTKIYTRRKN